MPAALRIFHVAGERFSELPALPATRPEAGFLWVGVARADYFPSIALTGMKLMGLTFSSFKNRVYSFSISANTS